ncbi:Uncharacterised protein r2_g607 [Pycnogonum litorale]
MSRGTFYKFVDVIEPYTKHQDTQMRKCVPVSERVAITLWRLGTNVEFRTMSHLFGRGKSTCVKIVKQVTKAITDHLLKKYIVIPSGDTLLKVMSGFERRCGFPQVGGAIDSMHIKILAPAVNYSDFYSRHHCHSMVLQAVVDNEYCFTNICVGWPGKAHDARIFQNSEVYMKGNSGELFQDMSRRIGGVDVPVLLIGDPAWLLLKPNSFICFATSIQTDLLRLILSRPR